MLKGFKVYDFTERVPYISVTANGVTFGNGVIKKLRFPEYVCLLFNVKEKQMAIQVASKDDENAIQFCSEMGCSTSIRINHKDFKDTIKHITNWDISSTGYRVEGKLLPEENAIIFNLDKAEELS